MSTSPGSNTNYVASYTQPAQVVGNIAGTNRESAMLSTNQNAELLNKLNTGGSSRKSRKSRKSMKYGGQAQVLVSSPTLAYNDVSAGSQSMSNQYKTIASNTNQSVANAQYDNKGAPVIPVPASVYSQNGGLKYRNKSNRNKRVRFRLNKSKKSKSKKSKSKKNKSKK
jgi:hypothetical protein